MFKKLKIFIILLFFLLNLSNAFEYQITGPKNVSSLQNISYRIIIIDNKENQKIPVKVYYKNKVLVNEKIQNTTSFNLDLSGFKIDENEVIQLNFQVDQDKNVIDLQYKPDMKAIIFTDKPLYQPGQTVYIKAVVFKNNLPYREKLELVIEDPKSNKLFYKSINPDNGLIFEKFILSDVVINGLYRISVQNNGKILSSNTFEVKKYTLPKFKIDLSLDTKEGLMVGKKYKGSVKASYFFGKNLNNCLVKIDVYVFDVGFNKIFSIQGKTSKDGVLNFDLKVPDFIAGIDKNKGMIKIDVQVEDSAGQVEQKTFMFDVFLKPINAYIIPSNPPTVGIENKFYLIIDSVNEDQKFVVNFKSPFNKKFETNGFLEFNYAPKNQHEKFVFEVIDSKNNRQKFEEEIDSSKEEVVFLFRNRSIYNVGDKLKFKLYSNVSTNVYLDFFVNNETYYRTVWMDSVFVQAFKEKDYEIPVNRNFVGQLIIRAYFVKNDGTIFNNFKSFIIKDPNELKINVIKNKDTYKARDQLVLNIETSEKANIFIDIVDEALLYLAKSEPELLKLYLQLERELLEPKYEAHSIKDLIIQKKETLLQALLDKKYVDEGISNVHFNFINSIDLKKEKTLKKAEKIYYRYFNYYSLHKKFPDSLKDLGLTSKDLKDEWGTEFKIDKVKYDIKIISAGFDRKFGTEDDVIYPKYGLEEGVRILKTVEGPITAVPKMTITKEKQENNQGENFLVRQYFPETFYSSLITVDKNYKLSLTLPDSITNWKAQFFGVSSGGKIGTKTVDITVFQEFFIDVNNPLFLTKNDEVSIPVVVYNYTNKKLTVKIGLKEENWFELMDQNLKELIVESNSVKSVFFRIKSKKIGINELTVYADSGSFKDAIKKQIEVIPDGFVVNSSNSIFITGSKNFDFVIPNDAIDDSERVYFYVYPSFSSQLLSGLDKLLSMPYGCFEQTSSINYPNILVLDYLRRRGISNPSIEMKAEYYLNIGYQRLLTFEVEGGGFSWFGDKPANKVLTAFGLMEFKDMKKVFFVDTKLIERTKEFLMKQQNSDGSWDPDKNYLHEESWGNIQKQKLTVTSYILMSLLDDDKKIIQQYPENIKKSVNFIYSQLKSNKDNIDNYTLGLILNIFAITDKNKVDEVMDLLEKRMIKKGDYVYWPGNAKTLFYGEQISSDIETTSIIILGLIKLDKIELANQAVKFLINSKDNRGMWYSTQPTILALKAITTFDNYASKPIKPNKVRIVVNNKEFELKFEQNDLAYRIVDVTNFVRKGNNKVVIESENPVITDLNYNFYLPYSFYKPTKPLLDIDIKYDRKELEVSGKVSVSVKVKNLSKGILEMVVLDLGIPPGFNVDISKIQNNPKVKNVETTTRQIIVYFEKIEKDEVIELKYDMVSKYPLTVKIPLSKAYEYYNPQNFVLKEGEIIKVK